MNKGGDNRTARTGTSRFVVVGHSSGRLAGFTIVETMIVLAVSGGLLLSAILLISGRQNKTAFTTALNNTVQQIQQTMNEVASGYFPQTNSYTCIKGAGPGDPPRISGTSANQGTNTDCVFLGKAMQFGVTGARDDRFGVYAVAGNKLAPATGLQVASLYDTFTGTQPIALAQGTVNTTVSGRFINNTSIPAGLPVITTLSNGLHAVSMSYQPPGGGAPLAVGGLAFLSSLGTTTGAGCIDLCSGAQTVQLYAVAGTALNQDGTHFADAIDQDNAIVPADSVSVCFASGGTDQSGLVTIGGSGQQLSTSLQIRDGRLC